MFRKHLLDDGCRRIGQAIRSKSFYGLAVLAHLELLAWLCGCCWTSLAGFLQTPTPIQGLLPEGTEFTSLPSRDACLHKLRNLSPPHAVARRGAAKNTFGHHQGEAMSSGLSHIEERQSPKTRAHLSLTPLGMCLRVGTGACKMDEMEGRGTVGG